ncbi:MAG: GDYXXLXY domain-containing protein [Clostridia bacterium]|nr:GDYXXLXY domain-containing protein [Clostridia bacterium]
MNKDKIKLLFLFLPLAIVFYFFISNLIISLNADEVLFITRAYDPYDIVMGRYLNVQIENSNEYILPEILGPVIDKDYYEGNFIK